MPSDTALNVTDRLTAMARRAPDQIAIAEPVGRNAASSKSYRTLSFAGLDADAARIARGLLSLGLSPGSRVAMLVRPGIDFIALVFALLRAGIVPILIDPGMGRRHLVRCLEEARPEGFIAIPIAQAVRWLLQSRFPGSRLHITVGRRAYFGDCTLDEVRRLGEASRDAIPLTRPDDPAAVIFTTGSTGPPKGVLYTQQVFDSQVAQIQERYQIEPGEIDLPGFPLFGLFNAAMGVTTILPEMDPTRPANVDPRKIIAAVEHWQVTQAFGSPALWNRVGRYCAERGVRLPTLRRVLSAGAAVPAHVLRRMKASIHAEGEIHTPYGATEALPVASISGQEVLEETQARTDLGLGVCVGTKFRDVEWKIIAVDDRPLIEFSDVQELGPGQIGELIVAGPAVTREYVTRCEANPLAKIHAGQRVWHRMGDVGYLDEQGRFWYCGRKAHRVETATGTLFTERCEAVFNTHPAIYRSALVGLGPQGRQRPVIVIEPLADQRPRGRRAKQALLRELRELARASGETRGIDHFLVHRSLPVDIRHNSKIFREQVAQWAASRLPPHDSRADAGPGT